MLCNSKLGVVNISFSVFAKALQIASIGDTFQRLLKLQKKLIICHSEKTIDGKKALVWCQEVPQTHGNHFCNFHTMISF